MNFFYEKQARCFFLSITVFCILTLAICIFFCLNQTQLTKKMLLEHDRSVASSLLERDVAPETIAAAMTGAVESQQGRDLLKKIGLTEKTATRFFPAITSFEKRTFGSMVSGTLILLALLLGTTLFFLVKRERTYQQGVQIVGQYMKGDYAPHLPRTEEGTLFRLFAYTENLALALQAKNETENQVKEFLKNTISDISHQLKTPLAALNMYHEIIADEPNHPKTVAEFSQKTATALHRMEQLIQSLLKITRLDAGSIVFEKERILVSELVGRAISELTTRAEREHKAIVLRGDLEQTVFCDCDWTAQAIGNIVKNALDHTGENGRIVIKWEQSPAMVRVSLSDNGEGIAPEDLHHIFKRFYRSTNSLDQQGVGLGLSLAKTIIEGQGGLLTVQSSLGEGTVFTLSFLTDL